MDPVKRKVISEIFFAQSVVLPIVGGISAALLSWAAGGANYLNAAAVIGILGGLGWMATRFIFKVEQITEQALRVQLKKQIDAENKQFEQLMQELVNDGDPRTQDYLTLLRSLRDDFWTESNRPGIQQRSSQLRSQIGQVFDAAVSHLRDSLRLIRLASSLAGDARRKVMADREELLVEVSQTIDQMRQTIKEFREITKDEGRTNLTTLREELEASIRVAKRTEEVMREMEQQSSPSTRTRSDFE